MIKVEIVVLQICHNQFASLYMSEESVEQFKEFYLMLAFSNLNCGNIYWLIASLISINEFYLFHHFLQSNYIGLLSNIDRIQIDLFNVPKTKVQ